MSSYVVNVEEVSSTETVNFDHIIHLHILDWWFPLLKMETVNPFVTLANVYHIQYVTSLKRDSSYSLPRQIQISRGDIVFYAEGIAVP